MRIRNDVLQTLLKKTKRTQTIDGKIQDQVLSCVLNNSGGSANTVSLVKDGVSSLSYFSGPTEDNVIGVAESLFITSIDSLLDVLKYHSSPVTLTQDAHKLRVKSSNKQTTLLASPDATAFPHNPATLKEWTEKAKSLQQRIDMSFDVPTYTSVDGTEYDAKGGYKIDSTTLFEALRCDSMNKQKTNQYRFYHDQSGLHVDVGNELKGLTTSTVCGNDDMQGEEGKWEYFDVTVQGGLQHSFAHINGDIYLWFFDFREQGQGIRLLFDLGGQDFIFQAGLI
tara:strand:+ start:383 stop:1225 length:843 start_codon:yes stop_codon:yes gene_type:complete